MVGISVAPDGTITSNDQVYLVPPPIPTTATTALQEANPTAVVITPESLPPEVGTPVGQYLGYPDPNQPPPVVGGFMSLGGGQLAHGGGIMPYDRAPSTFAFDYGSVALAPHAVTQRWGYTAPVGRYTIVQGAFGGISRRSAAAPGLDAYVQIVTVTSGAGIVHILCEPRSGASAVWDEYIRDLWQGAVLLKAGDAIEAQTNDASTGGTVAYEATCWLLEFNV